MMMMINNNVMVKSWLFFSLWADWDMFDIMIFMIMEMMMMKMENEITECVPSNRLPIVRI